MEAIGRQRGQADADRMEQALAAQTVAGEAPTVQRKRKRKHRGKKKKISRREISG